jgi:YbbR domain-containing protein
MGFLQRNWIWKLISLLLAFALYVWVHQQEATGRREFPADAEILVPPGQVLVDPPTPTVPVRVICEGPAGELEGIQQRDIKPLVRLAGQQSGQTVHVAPAVERHGSLASEEISVRVEPRTIAIQTQARIERRVQLAIDAEGALPEGWNWVQPPRADVDQVLVSGLKPTVDQVARVVATVRTLNPQEQVVAPATVRAVDRMGEELDRVTLDPAQVLVRARLTRTVWSKRVYVQPIFSVSPGPRVRVTVDPKRVLVYGTERALQELHFIETPEIDVPAGQMRYAREVRLELMPGITRVEPQTVRVSVEMIQPGEGR